MHFGVLTVRETVEFAVALRLVLPTAALGMTKEARASLRAHRVDLILDMLGLRGVSELYVQSGIGGGGMGGVGSGLASSGGGGGGGGGGRGIGIGGALSAGFSSYDYDGGGGSRRGLSGGELKRLTIAVEMVNLPELIFLDEPTSGLDSMTAHEVAAAVRALADQNRTVLLTVHQPSVATFVYFDQLLLLAPTGRLAYFGPLRHAVAYFHNSPTLGLTFNSGADLNPADFLVAAVAAREPTLLADHYEHSDMFKAFAANIDTQVAMDLAAVTAASSSSTSSSLSSSSSSSSSSVYPSTTAEQVWFLAHRQLLYTAREPRGVFGMVRHVLLGLFFGTLYRVDPDSDRNPQNVASLLFFCVFFLALGHQHAIPVYFNQRALLRYERSINLYSSWSLFASQTLVKWPTQLLCVFTFSLIVYWMVWLRPSLGGFFFFFGVLALASLTSLSLCELVASLAPSSQAAVTIFLPVSLYFVAFGGYIMAIPSLPGSCQAVPDTSYVRWAFQGLLINQYEGDRGIDDVLASYGFEDYTKRDSLLPLFLALFLSEALKLASLVAHQ